MKKILMVLALLPLGACHSKLLDRSKDTDTTTAPIISNADTTPPDFGITAPAGYLMATYFGTLDATHLVKIGNGLNSTVMVFIKDGAGWHKLKETYSDAFYYVRTGETIDYQGRWTNGKTYLVYEFTPAP